MAINTTDSPFAWRPDVVGLPATEIVPDALILLTSTVAGSVEGDQPSVRVPFVSEDATSGFVAEGAAITPTDATLDEVVVTTGKIAVLSQFSREQLAQPNAVQLITTSMSRSVVNAANRAYLGNATSPLGLTARTDVHDGGTIDADLDTLVDALTHVETHGGTVSHIIAHPSAWGHLQTLKAGTGSNVPLVGPGVGDAPDRRLLGVPVLTTPAMPVDGVLAVDQSAIISAVGQVLVARSDDYAFNSDSAAVRVTLRFGFDLLNADRVVKLTTGSGE